MLRQILRWCATSAAEYRLQTIPENETTSFTNRQRQITLALEGQVVLEQESGVNMVNRRIEDVIFVRNDYIVL